MTVSAWMARVEDDYGTRIEYAFSSPRGPTGSGATDGE